MILHNNTPLFPFDLERFKNGENAITKNGHSAKFIRFSSDPNVMYVDVREGNEWNYYVNGEFFGSEILNLYMLSPDPATIPTGAREKFENGCDFEYESTRYRVSNTSPIPCPIWDIMAHSFYCLALEINEWGFLSAYTLFGETFTKWIEFKDITFID